MARTDIVELNDSTFNAFVNENPLVLIEFANEAGPCIGQERTLRHDGFRLTAKYPDIKVAKMEATKASKICQELEIQYAPTMVLSHKDGYAIMKEGPHTINEILDFIEYALKNPEQE
jgi:hypothetical protein